MSIMAPNAREAPSGRVHSFLIPYGLCYSVALHLALQTYYQSYLHMPRHKPTNNKGGLRNDVTPLSC